MLNLLSECVAAPLSQVGDREALHAVLRRIKDSFVQRDYVAVFGSSENLAAYIANYTSSRSLCYYDLFSRKDSVVSSVLKQLVHDGARKSESNTLQILCLGAGSGGELLSLSRVLVDLLKEAETSLTVNLTIQDKADYQCHLREMVSLMRQRWEVPESQLTYNYCVSDLLDSESVVNLPWSTASFVTFAFVSNELFKQDKKLAVKFLMNLVQRLAPGSFLLVVDSAGNFSEIQVNGRSYHIYDLLDPIKSFSCVDQSNSQWYRVPSKLVYVMKLNNTRYFYRLYRKV